MAGLAVFLFGFWLFYVLRVGLVIYKKKNPRLGVRGVLWVLVLSVFVGEPAERGKKKRRDIPAFLFSAGFALVRLAILNQIFN
ncbi:hypothetical protein ACVGWV_00075, partial [Enterobacter asburiae]